MPVSAVQKSSPAFASRSGDRPTFWPAATVGRATGRPSPRANGKAQPCADQTPSAAYLTASSFDFDGSVHTSPHAYRNAAGEAHTGRNSSQGSKAMTKEERQRLVSQQQAVDPDLLARTVHLRFLPTIMRQAELADLCCECGQYDRVRICGNSMNNQNWIYGFVEFSTKSGAAKMLRKSGMELYNGPDRPPLRLQCSAAKQPIVDRVFHDADPASGTPCLFGCGNFATRSLKDALDSYFSLKMKEAQQKASMEVERITPARDTSGHLHPSAKSFHPYTGSLLPPIYKATGGPMEGSQEGSESVSGLLTFHTPGADGMLASMVSPVFNMCGGGKDTSVPGKAFGALASTTTLTTLSSIQDLSPSITAMEGNPGTSTSLPSTPEYTALLNSAIDSTTLMRTNALQGALSEGLDGEAPGILQRGRALVCIALQQANAFVHSQQEFSIAVGTLRPLIELLDLCTPQTGGAAQCTPGDRHADVPQKVTQLRLLANLMLALLYLAKRDLYNALPFFCALVRIYNEIPTTPLRAPSSSFSSASVQQEANASGRSVPSTSACMAVGETVKEGSPRNEVGAFAMTSWFPCFGGVSSDPFQVTLVDTPDMTTAEGGSSDVAVMNLLSQSNVGAEEQALYIRDVHFHSFALNTLLAAGLSLETAQPPVAVRVYRLVSTRSREVLNMTYPALEEILEHGDCSNETTLNGSLLPCISPCKHTMQDVTDFPNHFFTSSAAHIDEMTEEEAFWLHVPPLHCVRAFPVW